MDDTHTGKQPINNDCCGELQENLDVLHKLSQNQKINFNDIMSCFRVGA